MRPCTPVIAIALAGFLLGRTGTAGAANPVKQNGWRMNNLEAAQAEARKTGKPIFVVFRCEA